MKRAQAQMEGVPEKGSGHRGIGPLMMVGVGYTQRELCDGQSLASPGRWPPGSRVYPTSQPWSQIAECYSRFADHYGTEELLVSLASGKVTECPFPSEEISILNRELLGIASQNGFRMNGKCGDRADVPINFRFLQMLLQIADDPEIGLGDYSQGVRVGPGNRMPRLPALFRRRKSGAWHHSSTLWTIWKDLLILRRFGGGTTRRCSLWNNKSSMLCTIKQLVVKL